MDHVDCVVVGAGVVGLAISREVARTGRQVLILEASESLGSGTSSRGSGVIHAGLYYEPGSLKARLCVRGRDLLYAFADDHGVPFRRLGKLIVATSDAETKTLTTIAERAKANGVADLEILNAEDTMRLERTLVCRSALLSPSTGVIDARAFLQALHDEAESLGAVSAFRAPLTAARRVGGTFELNIDGATPMRIGCNILVNAAGHGAPAVAAAIDGMPVAHVPRGYLAKGNYFTLDRPPPFSRLIYPLPVPGGIGTHLTIDVAGTGRFGPDVEWIDDLDYAVSPERAASFYADIRRWWPDLPDGALKPSHAGIRPKISAPGEPGRDFMIEGVADHGVPGLVNLFGIESPGLTASLAIGNHVAALIDD